MRQVETIILGGGLTGLSAALHLEGDWLLVERESRLGGLTRTDERDGFLFDHTGHWLHLRFEHTRALVEELLGDNLLEVERRSAIYSFGRTSPYPFQANLFGLPPEVVRECLMGLIEAKMAEAVDEARGGLRPSPANFQEYVERHFGDGIAKRFMLPYNTKLWGCKPTEITADWCSRFVPRPSLARVVEGALSPPQSELGYNTRFVYPATGGIETLVRRMAERLPEERILTGVALRELDWRHRRVTLSDGTVLGYRRIISSIPLSLLLASMRDLPAEIDIWTDRLRCTSLKYLNLGLDLPRDETRAPRLPFDGVHWLYFPEERFPFYRIGCASNAVASLAPPGAASCYVELSNAHDVSEVDVLESVSRFLIDETRTLESRKQIVVAEFRRLSHGYVIFDEHYDPARAAVLPFLLQNGVCSTGRFGAWVYSSMEDALDDGIRAARRDGKGE